MSMKNSTTMDHGYQSDEDMSIHSDNYTLYPVKEESKECISDEDNSSIIDKEKKVDIFYTIPIKKRKCETRDILLYSLATIAAISVIMIPLCLLFGYRDSRFGGCISFQVTCPPEFERPPLILIAMNGFRYDYLNKWEKYIPTIKDLMEHGVTAPMRPVYPTNTFPNLYSIVTGLYPISHGITDNEFIDRGTDIEFTIASEETEEVEWFGGEPIWTTIMKNGFKSATFFWPGSDKVVPRKRPTMYRSYNKSVPYEERINTVLRWLKMDTGYRPYFYALYLEEPGSSGYEYGTDDERVGKALEKVDKAIALLMKGLKDLQLIGCANLILVSDHGMSNVDPKKIVNLKDYITNNDVVIKPGATPVIKPQNLNHIRLFDYDGIISSTSCVMDDQPFIVSYRSRLPKRLHYGSGFRTEILGVYLEEGWQSTDENGNLKHRSGGFHGSDNSFQDMTAVFLGYGPAFLDDVRVPIFDNIELYNMMCEILGINPANNNGTVGSLNNILRNSRYTHVSSLDIITIESECDRHAYVGDHLKGCTCKNIDRFSSKGNKEDSSRTRSSSYIYNLPFGKPAVLLNRHHHCIIKNDNYVTAYSKVNRLPLWTSFSIDITYNSTNIYNKTCYLQDMRVMYYKEPCRYYSTQKDVTYGYLYPARATDFQSLLETNTVPMYRNFKKIWEVFMSSILIEYVQKHHVVNVMVGPVFDSNSNGIRDSDWLISMSSGYNNKVYIPSDYFVILTYCKDKDSSLNDCYSNIKTESFVVPNSDTYYNESCSRENITSVSYVRKIFSLHRVRIKDIETVTSMSFYRNVYKTSSNVAYLKTYM
ncbi:alkaline phosphodiesterase [Fowlpox virus]|uniref:ORF FPV030 Alkaline phosphodiesterase n=2 Tax=Fowlpox virus TaxID=10261 RepID=Q9J5H1_FOWPN|nr:Alkaline phosphodiesterase [Fowlpox virus]UNS14217.1 ALPV-053 [Albatrosspox virus]AAF44374.1 ORF FPV030 Alkaline phosphodiesterase [Fowlpox virus]ART91464.1 alkaline phosphodiesterase [Fowlpox virus]AYO89624.1 alkaline phosphodiesterase [Fowlpox virus]AYO89883.1 alkaline phosphodiesterase [Fowlpox virus]